MALEIGQIVKGTVTGVKNFGAFVDLPDQQSGLVHISEVSNGFIKDINDYLSEGDEVNVKVIKLTDDGKINLSIKQAQENAPVEAPRPAPRPQAPRREFKQTDDFDKMMSQFLRDSEDRLLSLKRSTEGKRGGRGGRRR